jgi:putative hydrolase of the HAD superfamily
MQAMDAPLPTAVLLDLDDTILAFSASARPCWRSICERFAPRMAALTATALYEAILESRTWFWSDSERASQGRLDLRAARYTVVAEAFSRLGLPAPEWAEEMADTYARERDEAVEPFPGALEALRHLRGRGVRLGLLTNGASQSQRRKLERFGLTPLFDCIVIEEEFGAGKPDPRVFQHALAQLQALPDETWMVGDQLELDIVPARELGIRTVWIDHAGSGLPASSLLRPDATVGSLAELVAMIERDEDRAAAEGLTVLAAVQQRYGRHWHIRVGREQINPPGTPGSGQASPEDLSRFVCGVCGGGRLHLVTGGGMASVAGGASWYEFLCQDCGCYTEYEHEWG